MEPACNPGKYLSTKQKKKNSNPPFICVCVLGGWGIVKKVCEMYHRTGEVILWFFAQGCSLSHVSGLRVFEFSLFRVPAGFEKS